MGSLLILFLASVSRPLLHQSYPEVLVWPELGVFSFWRLFGCRELWTVWRRPPEVRIKKVHADAKRRPR